MKNFKPQLLFLSVAILVMACQNDKSPSTNPSTASTNGEKTAEQVALPTAYENANGLQTKDLVYAWVDKLNIRDAPNLKGKTIASVDKNDGLEFSGERSAEKETVVLRGVAYEDTWLKVLTPDKKEGWVFGGAVKTKAEQKGNDPITDTKFNFPHFGNFDLSQWKNKGTRTEGEEVDNEITTYQKGNQLLEITKSDMGEMYYGLSYDLMDSKKNLLKTRAFGFSGVGEIKELTEAVKDYTTNPAIEYTRRQNLKKHFYQLNARPVMVNGTWSNKSIEAATNTIDNSIDAEKEKNTSVDSAIQSIKEKCAIITDAINYKVDSTTVECERGTARIERRSTKKGELRYLLENACGEHGCVTTHHYFWENDLIFIFRQNYYYAGNSGYMQEQRTYFKNDEMFHCLEKDVSTDKGYEALIKLLENTANKTVDCTPNKRTENLQQLIELTVNKAKEFYCN